MKQLEMQGRDIDSDMLATDNRNKDRQNANTTKQAFPPKEAFNN